MRGNIVKGLFGLLGLIAAACGGATTGSDAVPVSTTAAVSADAAAPVMKGASHLKLGFAFTANLLGELEPCG